ncbi:FUSC family protein [Winogradskyella alexanderae]|uniref:FUSC family protein n=1 Tax=Winogradskyella alexanderae TaxID=2877123 RepID=A0ABS7XP93_9FLAO|nr:FUSC family protein [Winogradskyella alexanderae]MCA0131840.1 FUSC family protein [Winogradskyella alexanderae]
MKRVFIVLGFITAILATILAVTPLSNLAIIPIIVAFLCGLVILFISRKQNTKPKSIQYIFILVIISLGLTIYKSVFNKPEIGDTEQLEQRAEENLEDSKEILEEIEIDEDF